MNAVGSPILNFAVVDNVLWRGARPDRAGAQWLIDRGVETSINLEWEQDDSDVFANLKAGPRLTYIRLRDFEPLPWFAPSVSDSHVRAFLSEVRSSPKPVYVHCRSGQNRTGVMVAAYRLIIKNEQLALVLADFNSYKGFWAMGDSRYIETLYARKAQFSI